MDSICLPREAWKWDSPGYKCRERVAGNSIAIFTSKREVDRQHFIFTLKTCVVWPIFFLMSVFIALKGSHFWFLFAGKINKKSFLARTRHCGGVSGIIAITRYQYSAKFIVMLNSNLGLHLVVPGIIEITEPRALGRVLWKLYSKTIVFFKKTAAIVLAL